MTKVFTQTASSPAIAWKDTPTLGHLVGMLTQPAPCRNLDGYPLRLTGPVERSLHADGSGWFGTADLPPGEYLLSVDLVTPSITIETPVAVAAGVVIEQEIRLPFCTSTKLYLPVALRGAGP